VSGLVAVGAVGSGSAAVTLAAIQLSRLTRSPAVRARLYTPAAASLNPAAPEVAGRRSELQVQAPPAAGVRVPTDAPLRYSVHVVPS
jgi:hypothetical protein